MRGLKGYLGPWERRWRLREKEEGEVFMVVFCMRSRNNPPPPPPAAAVPIAIVVVKPVYNIIFIMWSVAITKSMHRGGYYSRIFIFTTL